MTNNQDYYIRKLLIYSIITLVSVVSVFLANYAMVLPLAAKIVSGFALLISSVQFLLALFRPHGWQEKEKYFLGMWAGPLLFSMNKLMSPVAILLFMNTQSILLRWMHQGEKMRAIPTGFLGKWRYASSELMWISMSYFILDVCREYTVWHEFHFQFLPTLFLLGVSINWIIFSRK